MCYKYILETRFLTGQACVVPTILALGGGGGKARDDLGAHHQAELNSGFGASLSYKVIPLSQQIGPSIN